MQHTADAGNISVWSDMWMTLLFDGSAKVQAGHPHGPMTRNAWVMSGTISHTGTHCSLM